MPPTEKIEEGRIHMPKYKEVQIDNNIRVCLALENVYYYYSLIFKIN